MKTTKTIQQFLARAIGEIASAGNLWKWRERVSAAVDKVTDAGPLLASGAFFDDGINPVFTFGVLKNFVSATHLGVGRVRVIFSVDTVDAFGNLSAFLHVLGGSALPPGQMGVAVLNTVNNFAPGLTSIDVDLFAQAAPAGPLLAVDAQISFIIDLVEGP